MTEKTLVVQIFAWGLSLAASLAAITAWGQDYGWRILPISAYVVFPLLGLLAFSLMWGHYVAGAVREIADLPREVLSRYFRLTSYVVLVMLCLHPGLLVYQRWRDGAGLPPGSYTSYVAPSLGWVVTLGMASLLLFLAFEFHRKYGDRSWWQYVSDASDPAMLAVAYHGLQLGSNLQQGWFRYLWWFYSLTLCIVLVRKYGLRLLGRPTKENRPPRGPVST